LFAVFFALASKAFQGPVFLMFKKYLYLEKIWMLLFFAGFMIFPITKAMSTKDDGNDNTASVKAAIVTKKKNYFLLSDTLPGLNRNKKTNGWEVLFDGKNTDKWKAKDRDSFPSDGWIIEDGTLFLNKKGSGDIITREKFSDFELMLDFKLTYGANSGIKYFVGEIVNKQTGKIVMNGPEYQIIDDYNNTEVKGHKHDIGATASCYLLYAPKNKRLFPAGKWNHVRIIAKGNHVEHWLNGKKVLSYERGSKDFYRRKKATKFSDYKAYGELKTGHILLTDHNDKVYFKNIKIKRL